MDFHPVQHTLLLGTNAGDISLWEVSSREKLMSRSFQATLIKDPCVSVKRILWSPMVLYLELHIQLYSYFGGNEIHQHLEIDAHAGSVNDLALCNPAMQLCAIPCGDDKAIKVLSKVMMLPCILCALITRKISIKWKNKSMAIRKYGIPGGLRCSWSQQWPMVQIVKVYTHLKSVGRVQEAGYLIVLQKWHTWQLNIQVWLGFCRKWHCLAVIMVISREHSTRLNPKRGTRDSKLSANVTNPWNEWVVHKA